MPGLCRGLRGTAASACAGARPLPRGRSAPASATGAFFFFWPVQSRSVPPVTKGITSYNGPSADPGASRSRMCRCCRPSYDPDLPQKTMISHCSRADSVHRTFKAARLAHTRDHTPRGIHRAISAMAQLTRHGVTVGERISKAKTTHVGHNTGHLPSAASSSFATVFASLSISNPALPRARGQDSQAWLGGDGQPPARRATASPKE